MASVQPSANDNQVHLRRWQGLAAISSLAAAILIGIMVTQPQRYRPEPDSPAPPSLARADQRAAKMLLVTQIAATDGTSPVAAVFDPVNGALRIAAATLVDPRHSAELWVIAVDGVPHSLGVLAPGKPATVLIRGANRPRLVAGSVLAVTIEPLGGSPDGKPTGAVVAKGALSVI